MAPLAFSPPSTLPTLRSNHFSSRQTQRRTPPTAVLRRPKFSPFSSTPSTPPRRDAAATPNAQPLDAGSGPPAGGGPGGSGGHGGGPGDSGESLPEEVLAVLYTASRTASSVPQDVLRAAASGRIPSDVLARVLAVESWPIFGMLIRSWPGLRNRLVANARFPMQLGVELTVGVTTKTLAEVGMRGDRFWTEFDFYCSDLALEVVGDAMLVWLLSPAAFFGIVKTRGVGGFLQALPKHAFQKGGFTMGQRGSAFLFKGAQFGLVGFVASVVGHSATTALVQKRKAREAREGKRRGPEVDEVELAPVLPTSITWGGFMFCSSNPRYQMLNGLEQRVLFPFLDGKSALFGTLVTSTARFLNCYVGGVSWIPFAKAFGIQ